MNHTYYSSVQLHQWISSFVEFIYLVLAKGIDHFFTLVWNLAAYHWGIFLLLIMGNFLRRYYKTFEVPVFIPFPSDATSEFSEALRNKRISLLESSTTSRDKLGVVFINHSRLEANVQNALAGFKTNEYKRLILIIVHCVPKSELPMIRSKDKLKKLAQYKHFAGIIDIAWYKGQGIYKCDMNTKAKKKLKKTFSEK